MVNEIAEIASAEQSCKTDLIRQNYTELFACNCKF